MRCLAALALVALAAGCGGGDTPPDDADVIACARDSGARVERGTEEARRDNALVPRGARELLATTWQDGSSAIVFRAGDAEAAERGEDELRRLAEAFNVAEDQVKRDGVFLTLLGPEKVPREDDAEALADCLT